MAIWSNLGSAQCITGYTADMYESKIESLVELKNSDEFEEYISFLESISSDEFIDSSIDSLIKKYVTGVITIDALNKRIQQLIKKVAARKQVLKFLKPDLEEQIQNLRNCIRELEAGTSSVPIQPQEPHAERSRSVYILGTDYPIVNVENTILQEGNFADRSYKTVNITSTSFHQRKLTRNKPNGDIIKDWTFDIDFSINRSDGSGALSELRPGDKIEIKVNGSVGGSKQNGRSGLDTKIIPKGFSEWTANPATGRKDKIWIGDRNMNDRKTWTLTAGEPGKEISLLIYFTDGRHTWTNKYVWLKNE